MTATLIDGVAISKATRESWRLRADALKARGVTPGLAVVIVGENPASKVYVRNKVKACGEMGLHSELIEYPESVSQAVVLAKVHALNADPRIHGILVQLPLPKHFDAERVLEAIAPSKDVDGFHVENVGALATGLPGLLALHAARRDGDARAPQGAAAGCGGRGGGPQQHRRQAAGADAAREGRDGDHLHLEDPRSRLPHEARGRARRRDRQARRW